MTDAVVAQALPDITRRLEQAVARQRLPGLAVGIVRDQSLAWSYGFGVADLQSRRPIDEDTLFRIASITKTFTSTAILQLRDQGLLGLDDPLARYLPEFAAAKARAGTIEGVTFRRLLAHHSGLTTEAPLPCWDALEFPSREALLAVLPQMEVVIPQDSAFKYSNLAFGLLGEVIARISGRSYDRYMRAAILDPLGMISSVFEQNEEVQARLASGYMASLYDDEFRPAPYVPLGGIAACGQLHSSVADLAKWVSLQFRTNSSPEPQVLAGATIEESHRPQYLEPDWSVGYCLGWRANRFGDRVYHGHGGGIYGFASQVLFSKARKTGVICLANLWPHPGLLNTSAEILDRLVDEEQAASAAVLETPRRATPAALKKLLGRYVAAPGIAIHIEYRDGILKLVKPDPAAYSLHAPAELEPTEESTVFVVRGGRGSGERIALRLAHDGRCTGFELDGFLYKAH